MYQLRIFLFTFHRLSNKLNYGLRLVDVHNSQSKLPLKLRELLLNRLYPQN